MNNLDQLHLDQTHLMMFQDIYHKIRLLLQHKIIGKLASQMT